MREARLPFALRADRARDAGREQRAERDAAEWPGLRARYLASLQSIRFPTATGPTEVIFPIVFSGPGK